MQIIVTGIIANLATNSLLFLFCPFVETKSYNQIFNKVGDLVTRNVSVFGS